MSKVSQVLRCLRELLLSIDIYPVLRSLRELLSIDIYPVLRPQTKGVVSGSGDLSAVGRALLHTMSEIKKPSKQIGSLYKP